MNLNQFNEKLNREFDQHPDKAFVIKSLLLIFVIIGTRMCVDGETFLWGVSLCFLNYLGYQCATSGKGFFRTLWDNVSIFDVPRTASKDPMSGIAWATWTIVIVNCVIFFCFQTEDNSKFIDDNLICLPCISLPTDRGIKAACATASTPHRSASSRWMIWKRLATAPGSHSSDGRPQMPR